MNSLVFTAAVRGSAEQYSFLEGNMATCQKRENFKEQVSFYQRCLRYRDKTVI